MESSVLFQTDRHRLATLAAALSVTPLAEKYATSFFDIISHPPLNRGSCAYSGGSSGFIIISRILHLTQVRAIDF